jgi:tetratricopeptide (TPR) repeat protein
MSRGAIVGLAVVLEAACLGCSRHDAGSDAHQSTEAPRSELGPLLADVRSVHTAADSASTPEARERAIGELDRTLERLSGTDPESIWLRQDLLVRLAELELALQRPAKAIAWSDRGLGLSEAASVPAADLLRLRGVAYEQLGDDAWAVESYHRALVMNQVLMERSLEDQR